ncbi:MAG: cytochrome c, class I [Gammaproteobacteria bacterium]|nr:cytochrome c, class I [Gammaproteobacteria bacterium]
MATLKYLPLALLVPGFGAMADEHRARVNYQIHCQGCHLPDASGFPGKVPRMNDFVGYFLHSREGREFLVRVPGVSASRMSDEDITEVMNWLLTTFSPGQLPESFEPFTVSEVAVLREQREDDPERTRVRILRQIAADVPELASELARADD